MPSIIVQSLQVESITGPTCYPGENGFSALVAYVKTDDAAIVDQLRGAAKDGLTVVIRCATLEVEGVVGRFHPERVAIEVDDLRYIKPRRKVYPSNLTRPSSS